MYKDKNKHTIVKPIQKKKNLKKKQGQTFAESERHLLININ